MKFDKQMRERIRKDIECIKRLMPSWNLDEWERNIWETISYLESQQENEDNVLSHPIEQKSTLGALVH